MSILLHEDGFGIHTFMLTRQLNYEEYRCIKLILQQHILIRRDNDQDCYIKSSYFSSLGYCGITAILCMQNSFSRLELIVNPLNLLTGTYNQTNIFSDTQKCNAVSHRLKKALRNIDLTVDSFVLSRIDLCVNYIMSPAMVKTYLKLGSRSYKADYVSKVTFRDNPESNFHSLTLRCKSYEVEIYDKEYEVALRTNGPLPEGGFGNILRIEARLERDEIRNYIHHRALHKILADFLIEEKDILSSIMDYCFYPGMFTTLENALFLIGLTKYNRKTKEIIEDILQSRGKITDTLKSVQARYQLSDKALQRIVHKIKKTGICMVTIPVRDAKECGDFLIGFEDLIYLELHSSF